MKKVLQFGEGNFLRAFAEVYIQNSGLSVSICQPRTNTKIINLLNKQNCIYGVYERGLLNGEVVDKKTQITCVENALDSVSQYAELKDAFCDRDTEIIISNTTEAGIVYKKDEDTFPKKITLLLYERYLKGEKPLIFLPCELIDNNAHELKKCILKYADDLNLDFKPYINSCKFYNTLVDRIVTGHIEVEGDGCAVACEPYKTWIIEAPEGSLPINDIVYTNDLAPYKKRKVRILNGLHTFFVPSALLAGFEIVRDTVKDERFNKLINLALKEILPAFDVDNTEFANSVIERFLNPFIDHRLDAIVLNSISKFKTRVLPSILDCSEPEILLFSLSALLYFYKNEKPVDDEIVIDYIKSHGIDEILENEELWNCNLSRYTNKVNGFYNSISDKGIIGAIDEEIKNYK